VANVIDLPPKLIIPCIRIRILTLRHRLLHIYRKIYEIVFIFGGRRIKKVIKKGKYIFENIDFVSYCSAEGDPQAQYRNILKRNRVSKNATVSYLDN